MTRITTSFALLAEATVCGLVLLTAGCGGTSDQTQADEIGSASSSQIAESGQSQAQVASNDFDARSDDAAEARRKASKAGKYLFAFFWKAPDEQTKAMRKVFDAAMENAGDRAAAAVVSVSDGKQKEIVKEYGLDRAPMPLVLAIAPNGAITGGFPTEFREEDLLDAFSTPCTEKCMKALQDGKLVFLCVQNDDTLLNSEALRGVSDFKSDERFGEATEVVMIDPSDSSEADFLADLRVKPDTKNAVTVFLAPPGAPIAMLEGATAKDQLVDTLMKAGSACGPGGCGPAGCSPQ